MCDLPGHLLPIAGRGRKTDLVLAVFAFFRRCYNTLVGLFFVRIANCQLRWFVAAVDRNTLHVCFLD